MTAHPAFAHVGHRPWPVPDRRWSWRQSWCDLLFAHWPIDSAALRSVVPSALAIQEFDGTAWIGVVPFRMEGVTPRPLPDLPWLSAFPEINVRTYVEHRGRPGIWFLSLDASNWLAVWAARRWFHLPYFRASMEVRSRGGTIGYRTHRRGEPSAGFVAEYRPASQPYLSAPGTLEHWLTERYCLYAVSSRGELSRTEVHHRQWPLQHAEADVIENTMLGPHGLSLPDSPPLLHFSRRLDVVVWSPIAEDR